MKTHGRFKGRDRPRQGRSSAQGRGRGERSLPDVRAGVRLLTGQNDAAAGLADDLFPLRPRRDQGQRDRRARVTTPPAVSLPLARLLSGVGIREKNIIIWDRTNRELKDAGYKLNIGGAAFQVYGTDTAGAGYADEPTIHRDIGSLFSAIQTDFVTASVSLAVLKDHGMAGVTAGMKNYFGAIHNPNKYHDDHCDPSWPSSSMSPPIKTKHRLTILDALVVQYHRGPSYHARWAEAFGSARSSAWTPWPPTASAGRSSKNCARAKGLPSLEEEGRPPLYIQTAGRMGLGQGPPGGYPGHRGSGIMRSA